MINQDTVFYLKMFLIITFTVQPTLVIMQCMAALGSELKQWWAEWLTDVCGRAGTACQQTVSCDCYNVLHQSPWPELQPHLHLPLLRYQQSEGMGPQGAAAPGGPHTEARGGGGEELCRD